MLALLSLVIWLYLFFCTAASGPPVRNCRRPRPRSFRRWTSSCPARDEVETIGPVIASLVAQDYPGIFRVTLVDDNSTDGTAAAAGTAPKLRVLRGQPKARGLVRQALGCLSRCRRQQRTRVVVD